MAMSEQVCEHGELRRQCVKCELASERDEYVRLAGELQSKLDRLQAEIDAPTIGWRDLWKAEQAKRIAAETRLDTLRALAPAESEGKELASRWATAVKLLEKAERERSEARSRLSSCLAELDEASPMRTCARCGKQDRSHRMAIEEGDEWECFPCWERCNAQERAAIVVEDRGPAAEMPELCGECEWALGSSGDCKTCERKLAESGYRRSQNAAAVEGRFTCLDCDAPIPEPGYCAPCIEKMCELIDPPAVKDRGPHANTCASLMGIDCDCSLSFEQKSVCRDTLAVP